LLIEYDVALAPLTTFGLPATAGRLVRLRTPAGIRALTKGGELAGRGYCILGGGSNVVFTQDPEGVVLKVELTGIGVQEVRSDAVIVSAAAGEQWQDLVEWTLAQGYGGLENLALIPGTVGAAPVQNIGAYGVELADRLEAVEIVDLDTGRQQVLGPQQCRLAYRNSIFKQELAEHYLITRIALRLPQPWRPVLQYPDLQARLEEQGGGIASPQQIFDWICAIRRAKLPDPEHLGNAGSFFKNPVVSREQFAAIAAREPDIRAFGHTDGRVKVAAGWLIEACGWKGRSLGQAAVHDRQALVLVNRGQATAQEVMALATAIQQSVAARFGLQLEIEPRLV
jgi:UDP-N-acetylmuramate dehydrogenase